MLLVLVRLVFNTLVGLLAFEKGVFVQNASFSFLLYFVPYGSRT